MNSMFKDSGKKKKLVIALIALFVVILILLLMSCGRKGGAEAFTLAKDRGAKYGDMEKMSREEITLELNREVEEGMMNISMNLCPVFEDGRSEGNLLIYNDPVNRYPQIVEIYRKDTGELIYRSGAIDVGYRVEYAALSYSLDAGEYPCTAYFSSVDPSTGQCLGKAGADIVIRILN